jgi:hypothetical protein
LENYRERYNEHGVIDEARQERPRSRVHVREPHQSASCRAFGKTGRPPADQSDDDGPQEIDAVDDEQEQQISAGVGLVVPVVWLFPFTLRLMSFIEGVSNLVEKHQVRPTHTVKTFD